MAIGDRWIYEHEIRGGTRGHPEVARWQQAEQTMAIGTIPEGLLIRRKVELVSRTPPPRWMRLSGESDILIRNQSIYYLGDSALYRQGYGAEFRKALAAGEALPDVCFPLKINERWGDPNKGRDLWTVAGFGPRNKDDPNPGAHSWRLEAHLASGDDNYVWYRKGVGLTASRTFHNGTYNDERVRLLRFEPARR